MGVGHYAITYQKPTSSQPLTSQIFTNWPSRCHTVSCLLIESIESYKTYQPGKRNTSLAFFTSHERNELKGQWGSRKTRLTRDSFLTLGSCRLCLLPARDPVSCSSHGHLFCRECAVSNLLAQSKEMQRGKRNAAKRLLEKEDESELASEEKKAKDVEDFESVQVGLGAPGVKRKRLDAHDAQGSALQGLKRRTFEVHDTSDEMPSFWMPSQLPENKEADIQATKQARICPASAAVDSGHEFTLKTLITVQFAENTTSDDPDVTTRSCPSCTKTLSNTTKAVLAKPCGHVLCKPCSEKFQRAPEASAHDSQQDTTVRCYVCSEDVTPGRRLKRKNGAEGKERKGVRGLVELSTEGTGFAGAGSNMVTKKGVAFQC